MKILLIDSNSIVNRAFYGVRPLTTKDGQHTNAIFGFFNITLKLISDNNPDRVVFTFDMRAKTFRHKMYDGYKATRKGMPEDLASQMPFVKEIITKLGYPIVELEGYEADDILGTFGKFGEQNNHEILLATGDKDSLQLVTDKVTVILATTQKGGAQYIHMTPDAIFEKYGVTPKQLIETKALMGDASDNIPGVRGVGEKTAFTLIQKYGTIQEIYDNIDTIEATPSVRKKLTEGKDDAFLSRTLGEIYTDVPCGDPLEISQHTQLDNDGLYSVLTRLELHKMVDRLQLTKPDNIAPTPEIPAVTYTSVDYDINLLKTFDMLYLYLEINKESTQLVIITPANQMCHITPTDQQLTELLSLPCEKWVNNSKPLHKLAISLNCQLENVAFDSQLAGYLLSPNSTEYTVERLSAEYQIPTPTLTDIQPCEIITNAGLFPSLCNVLNAEIESNDQQKLLHQIEIPLAEVLASMEDIGIEIDLVGLRNFGEELAVSISALEQEIYKLAGKEFNINSPKQMGVLLFEDLGLPVGKKTKSGYSTDADVLESLVPHHPVVANILEYRKLSKLKSTYVDGLDKVTGDDSVIRSSFNQTETRTGRISSLEPNMQNIPIRSEPGSRMRGFFKARTGCKLVDADYSQIELRVLAAIANDKNMVDAFLSGEDIHTNTAAQVFNLPPLFITPTMRSRAKAVNFGIVYGISAFSLAKDIDVTKAEADKYMKDYLATYSGVKEYMDNIVQTAKEQGYVTTLLGRRRYIPEISSSNFNVRSFGQRVAMNMPIQGTSADIIKIAMVHVYKRLQKENLQAKLILQVHDELIVEAPENEVEQVTAMVREEMESAISLAVPLTVDVNSGNNWGDAH